MPRRHPQSTLFPYTTLFRSAPSRSRWGSTFGYRGTTEAETLSGGWTRWGCSTTLTTRPTTWSGSALCRHSSSPDRPIAGTRSEEHTSELQSQSNLVCRLLLENAPPPPAIYTLSLHDALPICPVTLSVGEHVRVPRDYRGRDIEWWMDAVGVLDDPYDEADNLERVRSLPSLQLAGSTDRRNEIGRAHV